MHCDVAHVLYFLLYGSSLVMYFCIKKLEVCTVGFLYVLQNHLQCGSLCGVVFVVCVNDALLPSISLT